MAGINSPVGGGNARELYELLKTRSAGEGPKPLDDKAVAEIEAAILEDGEVSEAELEVVNQLVEAEPGSSVTIRPPGAAPVTVNAPQESQALGQIQQSLQSLTQEFKADAQGPGQLEAKAARLQERIKDVSSRLQQLDSQLKAAPPGSLAAEVLTIRLASAQKEAKIYQQVLTNVERTQARVPAPGPAPGLEAAHRQNSEAEARLTALAQAVGIGTATLEVLKGAIGSEQLETFLQNPLAQELLARLGPELFKAMKPEDIVALAQGLEQSLNGIRANNPKDIALGLLKLFQAIPADAAPTLGRTVQGALEKALRATGAEVEVKDNAIEIKTQGGLEIQLGLDGSEIKVEIGKENEADGTSKSVEFTFDTEKKTGEVSLAHKEGSNEVASAYDPDDKDTVDALAFSVKARYSDESAADEEGCTCSGSITDLEEGSALRNALEQRGRELGLDPSQCKVVFSVSREGGNVSCCVTLEAQDPNYADPDNPEAKRYYQVQVSVDSNLPALAKEIAERVATKVGKEVLEKMIPGIGQCIAAWDAGWAVGRFIGENVKIGDKTVDQYMQEMFQADPTGDRAGLEAQFKAGVAGLRAARDQALRDNPDMSPEQRQLMETVLDVEVMAMTAMARPESMTRADRDRALEKVELLERLAVLPPEKANALREQLAKNSDKMASGDFPPETYLQKQQELSDRLNQIKPGRSDMSDEQAIQVATAEGRKILLALQYDMITPDQAQVLLNEIEGRLKLRGTPGDKIQATLTAIANPDQRGSENRAGNTIDNSLGAAEWVQGSRERLKQGSKGDATFLMQALREGNRGRAEVLLARTPEELNARDDKGNTALMDALQRGDLETARWLIEHGADPNIANKDGQTPLMMAAANGSEAMVDLLLAGGADVSATDRSGNTPLMYAAAKSNFLAGSRLLEKGADSNAYNRKGQTALSLAEEKAERYANAWNKNDPAIQREGQRARDMADYLKDKAAGR